MSHGGFGQPQGGQQQNQPQQQFRQPQEANMQVKMGQPQQPQRQANFSPAAPQHGGQQQGGQPGQQQGQQGQQGQQAYGYQPPHVPEFKVAGVGGAPYSECHGSHRSRFNLAQLRQSDGIIPLQYGTNRFASQKGMTGFGSPRDVNGKHLHRVWDDLYNDEADEYERRQQQFGLGQHQQQEYQQQGGISNQPQGGQQQQYYQQH